MPDQPLAFFISFTTYGAWLHGKDPGSVDVEHNQHDTPFRPADPIQEAEKRSAMSQPAYFMDAPRRAVVLAAIREVCNHRRWRLLACHVRTTHVHIIVNADAAPEKVMNDCKAYASRRLTEARLDDRTRKRWTRHGSTKYVWDEIYLGNAIHYALHRQGEPMETYQDPEYTALAYGRGSDAESEPRP